VKPYVYDWRERFEWWLRATTCRIFGHSKKLEKHLREDLCARCRIVVRYHGGSMYR
jgi:hypothetical protein